MDLEKFFDRVNHDILMARLAGRIDDKAVLRLIRRYLVAGIMDGGVVMERYEGTPGGRCHRRSSQYAARRGGSGTGRRGHRFVRYADDCNVYVRSRRAGERVLAGLTKLYERLHLKVNEAKSAVARGNLEPEIPGLYLLVWSGGQVGCKVADKAKATFKQRIRK